MQDFLIIFILPLLLGWLLDHLLGDPLWLPHPVVGFGKMIGWCEHRFNKGGHRMLKGGLTAVLLVLLVFSAFFAVDYFLLRWSMLAVVTFRTIIVFYCLAGTTLVREVREVFRAVDRSLDEGRRQVARIVGRDTTQLSAQEIRTAALETLAENLSDGVIAPLFWLAVAGVPGMLAYKMVNTLDSMIGYRTERYRQFGCVAARMDDVANFLPARLTALLMVLASGRLSLLKFVHRFGACHASPNSGYPESALAGILNCRFGGPHYYYGELFPKPYIGNTDRTLTSADMRTAVRINRMAECFGVVTAGVVEFALGLFIFSL